MDLVNSKKNVIWNMLGTTANAFNSLFYMVIITRTNGLRDSGIFTLAFSLACLFCYIGNYEGRVYQVTDIKGEFTNTEYIFHRCTSCILMMIIAVLYCIFMKYDTYKFVITILLCLMKCFEVFSDVFYGILQKNEELYIVGQSLFFKSIFSIFLFIIVDFITKNLLFSCISLNVVWLILLLSFDLPKSMKYINKAEDIKVVNIINLYKKGFFSFAILFLGVYLVNAQKYALDGLENESLQAIFGIILMPATIISLAGQYMLQPILNTIANLYNEGTKRSFNQLIFKALFMIIIFGMICFLGAYLLGIPVLNILYGVDIGEYKNELLIIISGASFYSTCTLLSAALTTLRYTFIQFIVFGISSAFTLFISRMLISDLSLLGASLAYFLTMFFQFILYLMIYFIILKRAKFKEEL